MTSFRCTEFDFPLPNIFLLPIASEQLAAGTNLYVIGREAGALKVPAEDTRVSRRHCTIRRRLVGDGAPPAPGAGSSAPDAAADAGADAGGKAILEDHSLNGTYVNGERVPPRGGRALRHGDRVALARGAGPGAGSGGDGDPESDLTPEEDYVFTYLER